MSHTNDFQTDHAYSEQQDQFWLEVYRQAFPIFEKFEKVNYDDDRRSRQAQLNGVDRIVTLTDKTTIRVEEKNRRGHWPDIALEVSHYWGAARTLAEAQAKRLHRTDGWGVKVLACDYLGYAFIPTRVAYLLPFRQYREAWRRHDTNWRNKAKTRREGFQIIEAENLNDPKVPDHLTVSVAVPTRTLLNAIPDARTVDLDKPPALVVECAGCGRLVRPSPRAVAHGWTTWRTACSTPSRPIR